MRSTLCAIFLLALVVGCGGGGGGGGQAPDAEGFPFAPAIDPFATTDTVIASPVGMAEYAEPDGALLTAALGEVNVFLAPDWQASDMAGLRTYVAEHGGRTVGQWPVLNLVQAQFADAAEVERALVEVAKLPSVDRVRLNLAIRFERSPQDEQDIADQTGLWWIEAVDARRAWDYLEFIPTEDQPLVGIVDTGLSLDAGHFAEARIDVVNDGELTSDTHNAGVGHGTGVATLLGADGDDGECSIGIAWDCRLAIADVDFEGSSEEELSDGFLLTYLQGIERVLQRGARIVNCSFGPGEHRSQLRALQRFRGELLETIPDIAMRAGVSDPLFVFSAGNEALGSDDSLVQGDSTSEELLKYWDDHFIVVAACGFDTGTESLYFAEFTNLGRVVDLTAPGVAVGGGSALGGCGPKFGTSFAAPLVTGTCALLAGLDPALTSADIKRFVVDTAVTPNDWTDHVRGAWSSELGGAGILNAGAAVAYARREGLSRGMSACYYNGAAVDACGDVWMWGGMTESANTPRPVRLRGIPKAVSVVTIRRDAWALDTEGRVWSWGYNSGSFDGGPNGYDPTLLVRDDGSDLPRFSMLSGSALHTVALDETGHVWSWGLNTTGALGRTDSDTVGVMRDSAGDPLSDIAFVHAGGSVTGILVTDSPVRTFAVTHDGRVWAVGSDLRGALGLGTVSQDRAVPALVLRADGSPLTGVVRVATSVTHTLALDGDGRVWAWGYNYYGEGVGAAGSSVEPYAKLVLADDGTALPEVVDVGCATAFSYLVLADGRVMFRGQGGTRFITLDDGTELTNIVSVAVGSFNSSTGVRQVVLMRDALGDVWSLGWNNMGQLGINSYQNKGNAQRVLLDGANCTGR